MSAKKNVFAMIAVLSVVGLAYPGIGGGRGLFRVQNPLVEDQAGLSISLHAVGRFDDFGAGSNDLIADLVAPELNYAPLATKYVGLELFGSWGGLFQLAEQPEDAKQFDYGLHDLKAGAKLSIPVIPVLKLGASASYDFIGRNSDVVWLDPVAVPEADGIAWTGLASLQLQDVAKALPNIMFNVGKRGDYDVYAAGIELAAKGFGLFVEGRSLQPNPGSDMFSFNFGDVLNTEDGEIRLTPGVAFGSATSGMTFKAGYTFGFGDMAHNELILGLSIATPFGRRTPPEIGTIVATVTDARTGAALAANVSFPENPKMKPLTADAMTGVFQVDDVRAGIVVIDVTMEGYQRQSIPVNVEGDAVAQYEFKLRPLVTYGVIAGGVVDSKSRQPVAARIEIPGTEVGAVDADAGTGAFKVENVPVGVYTVKASAEGYYPGSQTVAVEEDRVASAQFELVSSAVAKSPLSGKVSDKATGKPLAATVSFPGSAVADIQVDPSTGVYMTEVPPGSYALKVASEGYLDQTAALIVEEGKPQIRNFDLVKEGMTITLKGIYFDVNKTTIKPQSHATLADAAQILKDNPTIRVEIQGHTDSQGSDEYNMRLSDGRAGAVVAYLVQNFGVDASRLVAKGYGETMPIADNSTADGRSLNRRVEFVILGK